MFSQMLNKHIRACEAKIHVAQAEAKAGTKAMANKMHEGLAEIKAVSNGIRTGWAEARTGQAGLCEGVNVVCAQNAQCVMRAGEARGNVEGAPGTEPLKST